MLPPLTDIVTCMFYKPWTIYAPLWQTSWLTCSIKRGQFLHWICLNVSSTDCIDLNCSTSSMSLMWRSFTGSSPARPSEFVSVRRNNSCVAMETVWPGGSFLKYVGFAIRKRKRKKKEKKYHIFNESSPLDFSGVCATQSSVFCVFSENVALYFNIFPIEIEIIHGSQQVVWYINTSNIILITIYPCYNLQQTYGGHCGCDRMVVGFTTTSAISAYHH
jgi:hypothetical protein